MRRLLSLCTLILGLSLSGPLGWSQTEIRGVVTQNKSNTRVEGAMLYLIDAGSNTSIHTTRSGVDGSFVFKSPTPLKAGQELIVRGMLLGYKPLKINFQYTAGVPLNLEMEETTFHLKEVAIKAPKVREMGDTIVYRTAAFAQKQDATLSQVLERLPGVEVGGSGQIRFEGKPINKFYIEQMDLLGRRYGIASNSLRPEDVAAVEIYRNHEPIRMLEQQSLSDRAALNIRLTERAKGRWLAWLSGGVGASPLLYDLNGRLMRFNSSSQGIYLAKANDTGKDISAELQAHEMSTSRKLVFSLSEYASPDFYQGASDALRSSSMGKRQRFHHSYVLSSNSLFKLGEHKFLRINAHYRDEHFASSRQSQIDFTLPDNSQQSLQMEERYRLRERAAVLEGDYEHNGDHSYFTNKTKVEYQSKQSQDQLVHGSAPYSQVLTLPYLKVENSLEHLFRIAGKTLTLSNTSKYLSRHQAIEVSLPRSQSVRSHLVDNSLNIGGDWQWGAHQLKSSLQWDLQYHRIGVQSSWDGSSSTQSSPSTYLSNSVSWTPRYDWKDDSWHWTVELPITHYLFRYPLENREMIKSNLSLKGSRVWRGNIKLEGAYRYHHNIQSAAQLFPGLKMVDSRRLSESMQHPYQGNFHLTTLNLSHTVPQSATAITAGGSYLKSRRRYTSSSMLQEGFIVYRQVEHPSAYAQWRGDLRVAQTFWQGKVEASVKGAYSHDLSSLLLQEQATQIVSDNYSGSLNLSLRLHPDVNIDYSTSIDSEVSRAQGNQALSLPRTLFQWHKGTLLVWLSDKWSLTATAEHQTTHESRGNRRTQATFVDAGLKFLGKKVRADLLFSNITQQKSYEVITVGGAHAYRSYTPLRPFEVFLTITLLR